MTDEYLNKMYPGCLIKTKGYMKKDKTARVYLSEIKKNPSCIIFTYEGEYIIIKGSFLTESALKKVDYNVMGEYYTFSEKHLEAIKEEKHRGRDPREISLIRYDLKESFPFESPNEKVIKISKILTEQNIEHTLKIEINGH